MSDFEPQPDLSPQETNFKADTKQEQPPIDTNTLSQKYQDGELDNLLADIKVLSGGSKKWAAAEMQDAIAKFDLDPDSLSEHDKKSLELLGRLAQEDDKIRKASEKYRLYKLKQSSARTYQEKVDQEGKDPFEFKFDPQQLAISKRFEDVKHNAEKIYARDVSSITDDEKRYYKEEKEHEIPLIQNVVNVEREILQKLQDRLSKLNSDPNANYNEIFNLERRLDAQKQILEYNSSFLNYPTLEEYWPEEWKRHEVQTITNASRTKVNTSDGTTSEYQLRTDMLRFSPLPEDQMLYHNVALNYHATLDNRKRLFDEPLPQIQLRIMLAEAMNAGDPRLTAIEQIDGMQVTGKVKRIIGAYEQAKDAGIKILLPDNLITDEEKRQLRRYVAEKKTAMPVAA